MRYRGYSYHEIMERIIPDSRECQVCGKYQRKRDMVVVDGKWFCWPFCIIEWEARH